MNSKWIALGAFWAALAVGLGAFGAHGLKSIVAPEQLETWHTAVLYHVFTALGLVLYGLFRALRASRGLGGALLLAGSVGFSGSLYAWVLGGPHWVVFVTPVGGAVLIAGWLAFAWEAWRARAA
ncbi:MAG: DUF423 domain-containing protein [Planctomycetes bacterium]|nr:DUF423 domain-containing protein [Planctomycetota bacterium]